MIGSQRAAPSALARAAAAPCRPSRHDVRPLRAPVRRRPGPSRRGQLGLFVGPQEEVDRGVSALRSAALSARTEQPVSTTRSAGLACLQPRQVAHPADDLLLGRLADRAAVDDDELGRLQAVRLGATGRQQRAGHLLGVGVVHLAAERPDVEARQDHVVGGELGERRGSQVQRRRRGALDGAAAVSEVEHGQRRARSSGGRLRRSSAVQQRLADRVGHQRRLPAPRRSSSCRHGSRCPRWQRARARGEGGIRSTVSGVEACGSRPPGRRDPSP